MHRINQFRQLSLVAAKKISSAVLALLITAMVVFLTTTSKPHVPTVHASTGCTEATLTGTYGFMWQGFDVLRHGTGAQLPWASAGVLNFDGQGGVSAVVVGSSIGGKISLDQTLSSGNYTVAPDCTGSVSLTSGPGAGETLNVVIVGGGAEAFLMSTTPTQTFAADAKRQ
jgi:hypothetical protein